MQVCEMKWKYCEPQNSSHTFDHTKNVLILSPELNVITNIDIVHTCLILYNISTF